MLHLRDEEIIALKEGNYSLLKEYKQHLAECEECRKNLSSYSTMIETFKTMSNNQASVVAIADRSFDFISREPSFSEKLAIFFKPRNIAFVSAAAICLFAALITLSKNNVADKPEKEVAQTIPSEERVSPEISAPQFKELSETQIAAESGLNFKVDRAKIGTLKKSLLKKIDNSNIVLAEGKIECDVEKGGNFMIHINNDALVRVLGTRFIVDASKNEVAVSVSEGMVEVINQKTGESRILKKDMDTKITLNNIEKNNKKPEIAKKIEETPKVEEKNPELSNYELGISSLKERDTENALKYFKIEINEGKEKGKALFETIRIYEGERDFGSVVKSLKKYREIMENDSVYKEEFYIKGCFSQLRLAKSLTFCNDYLKNFPSGYKREEITKLMEKNNE